MSIVTKINNPDIQTNLKECFKSVDEFEKFSALLYKYDAILAGGSILSTIHNKKINDLDIYVKLDNAVNFLFELRDQISLSRENNGGYRGPGLSSPYDRSFMARNNILTIMNTHLENHYLNVDPPIDLQIMVANVDDITNIPKNFDLTCCMIWYDGREVFTLHPDDVREKTAILQPDYVKAFLQGNKFTIKRLNKYTRNGYKIKYAQIDISTIVYEGDGTKTPITADLWITTKFMELISKYINFKYIVNRELRIRAKNHFSILILLLVEMKKIQRANGSINLLTFSNFKILFTNLYQSKLPEMDLYIKQHFDGVFADFTLTIDIILYIIMFAFGGREQYRTSDVLSDPNALDNTLRICMMNDKWKKYVEEATHIVLSPPELYDNPTGFNGEEIPLCEGEFPPLSLGSNGIIDNTGFSHIRNYRLFNDVYTFVYNSLLNSATPINILLNNYPALAATIQPPVIIEPDPAVLQARAAARTAQLQEEARQRAIAFRTNDDDDDEEEEEEGYIEAGGKQVPARCFNAVAAGNINTSSWYPDTNNILFLLTNPAGLEPDLVCVSVDELERNLINDNVILYKCTPGEFVIVHSATDFTSQTVPYASLPPDTTSFDVKVQDVDKSVEYIFFTYDQDISGSVRGYLPRPSVQRIVDETLVGNTDRVYQLSFVDTITHTAVKHGQYSRIGAYHCQFGSDIVLFQVDDFIQNPTNNTVVSNTIKLQRVTQQIIRIRRDIYDITARLITAVNDVQTRREELDNIYNNEQYIELSSQDERQEMYNDMEDRIYAAISVEDDLNFELNNLGNLQVRLYARQAHLR